MRIVCMTNEGQLPMMKNMLNSALKCGFPMNLFHCYVLDSNKESVSYNTREFTNITIRKLEVILMNMDTDSEILWVDNDIVFFENCLLDIRSKRGDFVMQDDGWGYCTGFFLARRNVWSRQIIVQSIDWLKLQTEVPNDQHAFNKVCANSPVKSITKLSIEEYPNGKVFFTDNKRLLAKMVHCNYLTTTSEKVQRFKDHGMWDESEKAFKKVNVHYI